MKKKIGWIILAAAMVVLIAGASVLYNKYSKEVEHQNLAAEDAKEETQELVMAPDFTVYDADGNAVNLSDYFGKPIVLNFWASWCGPCQMEMPDFEAAYQEMGEEVQFLMVNATIGNETLESAKKFIEDNEYTFPVYFDTDADAAMTYGVNSLPSTYFIDADGHALTRAIGMIDGETLLYGIKMITGQLEEN